MKILHGSAPDYSAKMPRQTSAVCLQRKQCHRLVLRFWFHAKHLHDCLENVNTDDSRITLNAHIVHRGVVQTTPHPITLLAPNKLDTEIDKFECSCLETPSWTTFRNRIGFHRAIYGKDGLENLALTGKIEGKRGRGRKRMLWMTSLNAWIAESCGI